MDPAHDSENETDVFADFNPASSIPPLHNTTESVPSFSSSSSSLSESEAEAEAGASQPHTAVMSDTPNDFAALSATARDESNSSAGTHMAVPTTSEDIVEATDSAQLSGRQSPAVAMHSRSDSASSVSTASATVTAVSLPGTTGAGASTGAGTGTAATSSSTRSSISVSISGRATPPLPPNIATATAIAITPSRSGHAATVSVPPSPAKTSASSTATISSSSSTPSSVASAAASASQSSSSSSPAVAVAVGAASSAPAPSPITPLQRPNSMARERLGVSTSSVSSPQPPHAAAAPAGPAGAAAAAGPAASFWGALFGPTKKFDFTEWLPPLPHVSSSSSNSSYPAPLMNVSDFASEIQSQYSALSSSIDPFCHSLESLFRDRQKEREREREKSREKEERWNDVYLHREQQYREQMLRERERELLFQKEREREILAVGGFGVSIGLRLGIVDEMGDYLHDPIQELQNEATKAKNAFRLQKNRDFAREFIKGVYDSLSWSRSQEMYLTAAEWRQMSNNKPTKKASNTANTHTHTHANTQPNNALHNANPATLPSTIAELPSTSSNSSSSSSSSSNSLKTDDKQQRHPGGRQSQSIADQTAVNHKHSSSLGSMPKRHSASTASSGDSSTGTPNNEPQISNLASVSASPLPLPTSSTPLSGLASPSPASTPIPTEDTGSNSSTALPPPSANNASLLISQLPSDAL